MSGYIHLSLNESESIAFEVSLDSASPEGGVVPAGIGARVEQAARQIASSFESAFQHIVRNSSMALLNTLSSLPERPSEAELIFGITATGELGAFAIATGTAESHYTIRLLWTE